MRPRVDSLIHFQYWTSSLMVQDLSFFFCSRSKICNVRDWALRAMIWRFQCMIALSALMGRLVTLLSFLSSTMTTSGWAASLFFSRMQTYESDSSVCRRQGVPDQHACHLRKLNAQSIL